MNQIYQLQKNYNNYGLGLFIDYSKAFNTINHEILLGKLQNYGFRGIALNWFKNYLGNRIQYVHVNESNSEKLIINSGVPQGSVLGPVLFILYTNDIINLKTYNTQITLFADDTNILITENSIRELYETAKRSLKQIEQWSIANKLSINLDKTYYMIFHRARIKENKNPEKLLIQGKEIKEVKYIQFLGVTIDSNLAFKQHIEKTLIKLKSYIPIFYKLKNKLNIKCKYMIYRAYVESALNYGIEIYATANVTNLKRLQIMQTKLIKILFEQPLRISAKLMYTSLDILNIDEMYKLRMASIGYSRIYGNLPTSIMDIIKQRKVVNTRSTRQSTNFQVEYKTSNFSCRDLGFQAAMIWNKIPNTVRSMKWKLFKKEVITLIRQNKI